MSVSTYLGNKILDHVWGKTVYTAPDNIYIGLSSTNPGLDGSGATEPIGMNYARVQKVNNTTHWPNAVARAKSNGTEIIFPTATGAWGTVFYMLFYDAASGGNFLGSRALAEAVTISNGDCAVFEIGDLDILFED